MMKVTHPILSSTVVKNQNTRSNVAGATAEPNTCVETTIGSYPCPQSDAGLATAVHSFSECAGIQSIESGSLDAHSKKEQSVIDSSDSIPNTEEFERLHEPEGEEMVSSIGVEDLQINKQNVAIKEPSALSNDGLLPLHTHIYKRRKTKNGMESTEIVHPAVQCSSALKKSNQESSIGKDQRATDSECDRKLSHTKVLSHYVRKRSRDVERDVTKAGDPVISCQELGKKSKHVAVSAGIQAHSASNMEKITFKDALHRDGGSQMYLECRHSSSVICADATDSLRMCSNASIEDIAAITKPWGKFENSGKFEVVKKMENNEVPAFSCKANASSRKSFSITGSGADDLQSKKSKVLEKEEIIEATYVSYNADPLARDARHYNLDRQKQSSGCSNAEAVKKEMISEPESSMQAMELSTTLPEVKCAVVATSKLVDAPAKAQQSVEAANCKQPELPKIMSFQKFAKRENMITGEVIKRRPLKRETLALYGKGLVTTGVDARHSKVRDWSIDFSDSYNILGSAGLLGLYDNIGNSRDGFSSAAPNITGLSGTEIAGDRHESGVTCNQDEVMPSSKEVTDDASAGSSIRGSHQKPSGVCLASLNSENMPFNSTIGIENEKHARSQHQLSDMELGNSTTANPDRGEMRGPTAEKGRDSGERCSLNNAGVDEASPEFLRRLPDEQLVEIQKTGESFSNHLDAEKCSDDSRAVAEALNVKHQDTSEQVKKAVTDFVAQLLTPLYKTRRINKDTFKSMMKKATSKVMERRTEQEATMEATEFLDTKRKLKIRSLIDKLVEQYLESVNRK